MSLVQFGIYCGKLNRLKIQSVKNQKLSITFFFVNLNNLLKKAPLSWLNYCKLLSYLIPVCKNDDAFVSGLEPLFYPQII